MSALAELDAINTIEEVASFAKVHPNTVRRAIKADQLEAVYAGVQVRIRREAVWRWLRQRDPQPEAEPAEVQAHRQEAGERSDG